MSSQMNAQKIFLVLGVKPDVFEKHPLNLKNPEIQYRNENILTIDNKDYRTRQIEGDGNCLFR